MQLGGAPKYNKMQQHPGTKWAATLNLVNVVAVKTSKGKGIIGYRVFNKHTAQITMIQAVFFKSDLKVGTCLWSFFLNLWTYTYKYWLPIFKIQ